MYTPDSRSMTSINVTKIHFSDHKEICSEGTTVNAFFNCMIVIINRKIINIIGQKCS